MERGNFGVRELAPAFKAAASRRTPQAPLFSVMKANRNADAGEPPTQQRKADLGTQEFLPEQAHPSKQQPL